MKKLVAPGLQGQPQNPPAARAPAAAETAPAIDADRLHARRCVRLVHTRGWIGGLRCRARWLDPLQLAGQWQRSWQFDHLDRRRRIDGLHGSRRSESDLEVYESTRDEVRRAFEGGGIVFLNSDQGVGVMLVNRKRDD